jgi:hypothetical protein
LVYRNIGDELPEPLASLRGETGRCPVCVGSADVVVGQPDFTKNELGVGQNRLRRPTAVATDGTVLVVADTDNNRVLIWRSIPTVNDVPADVVVGQANFTETRHNFGTGSATPSEKGLRGPQGVWIQNGRLYVADTQNHRVLMWNSIPTQNGQGADLVLGKPNFSTFVEMDLTQGDPTSASPTTLLNPVSVSSDGTRLLVADLGHNRVLIWNSIPTQNAQPADIALGQPDISSTAERSAQIANNSRYLCAPSGKDTEGNDTYPALCSATLNFPRFALSDGQRLYVADGGNDRILIWNSIPTRTGQPSDVTLGQLTPELQQDSEPERVSSADTIRTPMALATDGQNLFVSDPFNRRIMVFTPAEQPLPGTGVRNAASRDIFAVGAIQFESEPKENDEVTFTIGERQYKYKATAGQNISHVITGLVEAINGGAGDPEVFAVPNQTLFQILLTAKTSGDAGNAISFTVAYSAGAQLSGTVSGTLTGGQNAAKIAPGTLVTLLGENLSDVEAFAPTEGDLPTSLGNVEVYFDGIAAPLIYVSPGQINAQMPWEVNDVYSVNAYVRTVGKDGKVRTTTAIAVPIVPQNPGIFASEGTDPRPARALHGSGFATGVVSIDGAIKENDVATIKIEDREYKHTVRANDTLEGIRAALVAQINEAENEKVEAIPSTVFNRILLRSRIPGPEGEAIGYTGSANEGASVIVTAFSPALCCASVEGAPITEDNPARPGEVIKIYATGLGIVQPDEAKFSVVTGQKYGGPVENQPNSPIDAIAGGKTANVLFAGLKQGTVGMYELIVMLNSDMPTNPLTQMTIAQETFISNIVTFPVLNPFDVPEEP